MPLLAKKTKQNETFFNSDVENYCNCDYCGVLLPHCHCKCPYCDERDKCECALFDAATGG